MIRLRFVVIPVSIVLIVAGCGGSPSSPSSTGPQIIQGTVSVPSMTTDSGAVVHFQPNRAGNLSVSVDWTNSDTDIDILLLGANCTLAELAVEAPGCHRDDVIAFDESLAKPAVLTTAVTAQSYTLVVANWASTSETVTYRLEIS